jgi:hypothetical protein
MVPLYFCSKHCTFSSSSKFRLHSKLQFQLHYLCDSKWPPWLSMHSWALRVTEVTALFTESWSFLTWAQESIIRFSNSALLFDLMAYTRDFMWPHILLAKQPEYLGQSSGLESADSEMQSPAYQNEDVRLLLQPHLLSG